MNQVVAQLKATVEHLTAAGRAEGIEPDGPLGRWLEAQAQSLSTLADLLEEQSAKIDETLSRIASAAGEETEQLRVAIAAAKETTSQADRALQLARNLQIGAITEQENVTIRMIDQTLPLFVERLQKVLVIREQRWNSDVRRRRYAAAGALVLTVFLAGFGLSWWQDSDRVAAMDQCLAHPLQASGHYYCSIDTLFGSSASAGK
jgi:hypothetical protein